MAWIRITTPTRGTEFIPLEDQVVTIGRSSKCTIALDDTNASRLHCELMPQSGGGWILKDRESKNGTYVNGTMIDRWTLSDGDLIQIGDVGMSYQLKKEK